MYSNKIKLLRGSMSSAFFLLSLLLSPLAQAQSRLGNVQCNILSFNKTVGAEEFVVLNLDMDPEDQKVGTVDLEPHNMEVHYRLNRYTSAFGVDALTLTFIVKDKQTQETIMTSGVSNFEAGSQSKANATAINQKVAEAFVLDPENNPDFKTARENSLSDTIWPATVHVRCKIRN